MGEFRMKKYRIKLKEQYFEFDNYHSAKMRALELLHQNCWWFSLETINEEPKEKPIKPKQKKKIKGKK